MNAGDSANDAPSGGNTSNLKSRPAAVVSGETGTGQGTKLTIAPLTSSANPARTSPRRPRDGGDAAMVDVAAGSSVQLSARFTSRAACQRASRSLARQAATTRSSMTGTPDRIDDMGGGCEDMIDAMTFA